MKYTGQKTHAISFPLGGIGTGSVGLSGSGRLVDWEVFGSPNKQSNNGYSHFAIKTEKDGKVMDTRVLNSDLPPHYMGNTKGKAIHTGYGFGPDPSTMAGFPHFKDAVFTGEFPLATIDFSDESFYGNVSMTAFNPFIPLDDENSSLPAAFFEIYIHNTTADDLYYTNEFAVQNNVGTQKVEHRFEQNNENSLIRLECNEHHPDSPLFGNFCIGTDHCDVSYQEYWYRGGWSDGIEMYWHELSLPGKFKNRSFNGDFQSKQQTTNDVAVLAAHTHVRAGDFAKVRFVLAWYFPTMSKNWDIIYRKKKQEEVATWKNYYASRFQSAYDCAVYALGHYENLYKKTKQFHDALFSSSLPIEALDAISANISILKTPTVLRLADGSFYGFEGCIDNSGCCEGSCQHVWNYAYALPFLFPKLERSMRDLEFTHSMRNDGRMGFRLQLPLGTPPIDFRACVDGQMGAVIKAYRDWKICGDGDWLRKNWDKIKLALEYAWASTNEDQWDINKTGVITGRQHHTLDMELFGPNSWLQGFYLCALRAASEMAAYLGEIDKQKEYDDLFKKGSAFVEENLWNGEYYGQTIDIADKGILEPFKDQLCEYGDRTIDVYWNDENQQIKYQLGGGLIIDQVLAQWHANNCGLGNIFDPTRTKTALKSLMKYNFIPSMRDYVNPWRLFCLNDESGMIMCSWPDGREKPVIPITYNGETMHGFEYQVACHMIQSGMIEEAETIVGAIRARYDGYKRNPFNEIECGSNYARSMASFGLLLAYSGFSFDMANKRMGFHPAADACGKFLWSIDSAWGVVLITKESIVLSILGGKLSLYAFDCSAFASKTVRYLGKEKICTATDTCVQDEFEISVEEPLQFSIH